ncbi:MAG: DUF721 domain-containing protein [Bacteroidales bacterium]|nr:DUF721 domain-containing protein [Bacteroidales bacterium]
MQPDRTVNFFLQKALRSIDNGDYADGMLVERAYRKLVGDFIGRLTVSVQFTSGVLSLRLATAALRSEMMRRRESLRRRINEELHGEVVKKIYIS